jgi:hypothetical protein
MTEIRPTPEDELIERIRAIDVRAPDSLHRTVESMIAGKTRGIAGGARGTAGETRGIAGKAGGTSAAGSPRAGRPFGLGPRLASAGAIAAVVVALAIVIGLSGGSSTLSVRDASAPTLRHATTGPPAESSSNRRELMAAVDGVSFPYWDAHFGWRSTGSRTDRVDGRAITTIFYANRRGQRVGYSIVAGTSPAQMSGGIVSMRDGTPYRLLTVNGTAVVSWLRSGHLCVVSGRGVDGATLLRLASWDEHRPVAS